MNPIPLATLPDTPPPVKLLLVDDEEANLTTLQAMLADLGHPMVTARSAQETFRHLLQDDFAVVLLDVKMPDLNGLELAALLHERDQPHLTPIIFITAHYSDAESVVTSYRAGGVDYLIKPVNPEILRAKVHVFTQLAQARQQLAAENAERRRAEMTLQLLNSQLEQRVAERTADLTRANEALVREIAERKLAEQELRQAKEELANSNVKLEEMVQERTASLQEAVNELELFSYSITHDMRAPLRALQGFSNLLSEACGECADSERREHLRRIATSAKRMDCLITDALSYCRAAKVELPLAPVDPEALLREIIECYPFLCPPKANIEIRGAFPRVIGNQAGLTQCFSNLLDNAVKFVQPGVVPHIRIWAEPRLPDAAGSAPPPDLHPLRPSGLNHRPPPSPTLRLWFQDNGIGIPKSYQEQIFRMFFQAHKGYEGTGIGLALVRKVMQRMGGQVGVESEPGQGSRFWLDLRPAPAAPARRNGQA